MYNLLQQTQTTFITVNNTTTATNLDVDYVRVSRADIPD